MKDRKRFWQSNASTRYRNSERNTKFRYNWNVFSYL